MASFPSAASRAPQEELRLLVDMVRLSRVTLLIAETGSDKSGLLQSAVMPLLSHRRRGAEAEIPVFFDEWHEAPLPALHALVRQAAGAAGAAVPPPGTGSLVANLREWQEALDVTFIIVLDRFEQFLGTSATRTGFAEFEETFVQMANDPMLRVNFLLALDEDAEPLLARLKRHIPRLGYSRVRVPRAGYAADVRPAEREAGPERARARRAAAPPPPHEQPASSAEAAPAKPREQHAPDVDAAPALSLHVAPLGASGVRTAPEPAEPPFDRAEPPRERESSIVASATRSQISEPAANIDSVGGDESQPAHMRARDRGATPMRPGARFKHGLRRLGWAPLLLIPAAWFLFIQPNLSDRAERGGPSALDKVDASKDAGAVATPRADKSAVAAQKAPVSAPSNEGATQTAPVSPPPAPPRAEVAAPKPTPALPPSRAEVTAPKPTPASPPPGAEVAAPKPTPAPPPPRTEVAAPKPTPAPPPPRAEVAAPKPTPAPPPPRTEVASSKAAPPAAKPPVAVAPATPPGRKPEAAPAKPAAPPPVAASAPVPPPQAAAVAKAPVPAPAAVAPRAPSGPVLHILVRNEAQRARAEQLVGPLRERGIHVAGVRVVPPSPDAAHIRYYRLNDRNEAMRVAVTLRDLGFSAQQLKQMPEPATPGPGRTYELWLP